MSLPPALDIPQQLTAASKAWTKLRRMAAYAAFDGWALTVLGALTFACNGYGSAQGLLISFVLLGTGMFEIYSVRQFRHLKPSAITHLAYNQLILAGGLIVYSIVSLVLVRHGAAGGGMTSDLDQALAQAGASDGKMNDQVSSLLEILYAGLIACALLIQGGTARYYLSRKKYLREYLEQTPDWIQQMQRERGEFKL